MTGNYPNDTMIANVSAMLLIPMIGMIGKTILLAPVDCHSVTSSNNKGQKSEHTLHIEEHLVCSHFEFSIFNSHNRAVV